MADLLARLFAVSESPVHSLNAQAAMGVERAPKRSQFSLLVRHFLERFFNHESFSPDGDAKARLVLLAFVAALPGFTVALYLWPLYHPFMGSPAQLKPPPYWVQVNHHFFFVMYSFVVMGIVTVFQWGLFFPDLLDVFVLSTLPIIDRMLLLARVTAITILLAGFLFDANLFTALVLPISIEPHSMSRFYAGHLLAMACGGLFSAAFILGLQGVLLSILGARLFRKISLFLQGLAITLLLMLLLLFPVVSDAVPVLLEHKSSYALWFPPFWFLGIYQRLLEGPSALPIYSRLAHAGGVATLLVVGISLLAYPFAYVRRVRQLMEGAGTRDTRNRFASPLNHLLHASLAKHPLRRAVWHFINQTLLRVQRYRIYLVLYGGVGLSVVAASVLRLTVTQQRVGLEVSADGIRAALGIVAFWTIAGLRIAFVSSGNQQGSWVFRVIHGRPPVFDSAVEQRMAAKEWALLWGTLLTLGAGAALHIFAPAELRGWPAMAGQFVTAVGLCVLLSDVFFLNVTMVPFTGEAPRDQPSLAITLLKYFAFIPVVTWLSVSAGPWLETGVLQFVAGVMGIVGIHLLLRWRHRAMIQEHCNLVDLEEGEEEFPMKLGLR